MDRYQSLRYEMFLRVREFGTTHRQLFPESSTAHKSFAALATAVDRIRTHTTAATLTAGEGRKPTKMLREAINDRLITLARTSRELTSCSERLSTHTAAANRASPTAGDTQRRARRRPLLGVTWGSAGGSAGVWTVTDNGNGCRKGWRM